LATLAAGLDSWGRSYEKDPLLMEAELLRANPEFVAMMKERMSHPEKLVRRSHL